MAAFWDTWRRRVAVAYDEGSGGPFVVVLLIAIAEFRPVFPAHALSLVRRCDLKRASCRSIPESSSFDEGLPVANLC